VKTLLPLVVLLAAACQKDAIEVRKVAKEDAPAASAMAEASARPSGLHWTTPKGWTELAGNGMRAATLQPPPGAGKAEVTVIALPGDVGGELANVNRWRGQISLPPVTEEQLGALRSQVRTAAGSLFLYDFTSGGQKKTRLVAGMIQASGTTWFFKLMGDAQAVDAARPAFLKMLEGLKSDAA
jgi:hypothetical protein